jgi:predicted AlkP superfamily phosphohydrolase/phosphomutase/Flp pilus assembly protein TadD
MNRLLLVGWDAADWKVINPLLAAGEMPNLGRLLEQGVHGNLATIHPPLSPMVWTSIATGKRPPKHGILGFTEPTPDGLAVRPVTNLGRTTRALWNMLHLRGKRSIVVGWWPSHPAEPTRGAMVSDLFPLKGEQSSDAIMPPGTVSPPELAERMAELRVHPTELNGEILALFAPDWEKIDQDKDQSVHDLAGIIAETMSIHNAATELMKTEAWDLAAVYYAGIDHFSHRFMRYHAGKRTADRGTPPDLFAGIVQNAYRYHDAMLGRLGELAGPECAVMVVSDHGFHSDRLLPDYIPAEAAGPAVEHRPFGIFALRGPGVRAGERIYGASVLDVAPTALHVLRLPAGLDMDGKVLLNAFRDSRPVDKIESWDAVEGEDGRHAAEEQYDGAAAAESLRQLVDLGYVAPPGEGARPHADAGRPELAVPLLRELIARDPEQGRHYSVLAACLMQLEDVEGCRRLLDDFDLASAEFAPRAAEELKRRQDDKPDQKAAGGDNQAERREMFERRQLAEKAGGFELERAAMRCRLALGQRSAPRQKEQARALLEKLAQTRRQPAGLQLFLAQGFAALKEHDRALEMLKRVRRADRDNWEALELEARIHFAARRYEQAVNCAVESLSLVYFQPTLHHLLGVSLARLGEREKAEQAFRAVLAQAPEFAAAHEALARLISRDRARLGERALHLARAAEFRRQASERRARRREAAAPEAVPPAAGLPVFERSVAALPADRSRVITVVAGLPRSGTSMMMQVLAAAGLAPFTDEKRLPDEDNPHGYFEHERAMRLHEDPSWLAEARGKAVKIVAQLVPYLPPGEQYRVIFMHRDLREVVASQRVMLERLGRKGAGLSEEALKSVFTRQWVRVQTWLRHRPQIPVLAIHYAAALADPAGTAEHLAGFVGVPFDRCAAAAAVDPSLRRQKAVEPTVAAEER